MGILDDILSSIGIGGSSESEVPTIEPIETQVSSPLDENPTDLKGLLQSNDLGSLRASYSDLLRKAVETPARAEPRSGALIASAGIPLVLSALFGGGRGIAAAASPVADAYSSELERATKAAATEREQSLQAAKLVENRISDVENTFEKAQALKDKREQNAESNRLRQESIDNTRLLGESSMALRQDMAGMRHDAEQDRNDDRDANREDRRTKQYGDESTKVNGILEKRLKPLNDAMINVDNLRAVLENNDGISSGAIKSLVSRTYAGEKGVITNKDIDRLGIGSAQGDLTALKNWISGDSDSTLTDSQMNVLKNIVAQKTDEYQERYQSQVSQIRRQLPEFAPLHARDGKLKDLADILEQSGYPGLLGEDSGGLNEDNTFNTPDGQTIGPDGKVKPKSPKVQSLLNKLRSQ